MKHIYYSFFFVAFASVVLRNIYSVYKLEYCCANNNNVRQLVKAARIPLAVINFQVNFSVTFHKEYVLCNFLFTNLQC
jgi:hypothetical protein